LISFVEVSIEYLVNAKASTNLDICDCD
jgi:hypothetical protein